MVYQLLQSLKIFFELRGYICKGITNSAKGLEELNRLTPKLILFSLIYLDISVWDVCKEIRFNKNFKEIPIHLITIMPESLIKEV